MAEAGVVQGEAKTPSDFLKSIRGKPVIVKLNSGVDYRGEHALNISACASTSL
jgi:U6 snRNA-associated Sm-like protein LSm6